MEAKAMTARWDCEIGCLDELEHAVYLVKAAHKSIQTQSDLDRVRRAVLTLDAIWATRTREMEKADV